MVRLVVISTTNLNQWALDWTGNLERIKQSITTAKSNGAVLRVGPELEVSGYGLLDHFLENDVYDHALASLYELVIDKSLYGIVIDLGMPIMHRGNRYVRV